MILTKINDPHFRNVPTRLLSDYTNSLPGASAARQEELARFMETKVPNLDKRYRRTYPTFSQLYLDPALYNPLYLDRMQPSNAEGPWLAPQPYSFPEVLYTENMRRADGYAPRRNPGFLSVDASQSISPKRTPVIFSPPGSGIVGDGASQNGQLDQWRRLAVFETAANDAGSNRGSSYMSYRNSWGTARWPAVC